jgi:hypothetical protein
VIDGAVAAALDDLARRGQTIAYGALARQLGLTVPGSIATLTDALERLMAEDAAAGRPFRASLCEGRLDRGLPAPGFFAAAARLGRDPGPDPAAFVAAERAALCASGGLSQPGKMA